MMRERRERALGMGLALSDVETTVQDRRTSGERQGGGEWTLEARDGQKIPGKNNLASCHIRHTLPCLPPHPLALTPHLERLKGVLLLHGRQLSGAALVDGVKDEDKQAVDDVHDL